MTLNPNGVVRSRDLEGISEEEICENLSPQGVTLVKRITLILTFRTPTLSDSMKAGCLSIPVVAYIPNPLQCFKYQRFEYGQNICRGRLACARCDQFDQKIHESKTCQHCIACTSCDGKHFAYWRE